MSEKFRHKVTVVVGEYQIDGWTEYDITSSMIDPSDTFSLVRPFSMDAWLLLRRDARVRVYIDGAPILDGLIDSRTKRAKDGTFEIAGRDRAGRLVQESAPRVNYQGIELTEAIRRLADPWFTRVTLSDARNRKLRMGKSRRIPTNDDPIIVRQSSNGSGRVSPGEMRWKVIEELVSQAGLICWSSTDGKELIVGRPNHDQAPSFIVRNSRDLGSTCIDLIQAEDNGDRYSLIAVVGNGGGTDVDFGMSVASRHAFVVDNVDNLVDGTGVDFIYPKRLLLTERNFDSNADASRVAAREQARRDFRRLVFTAEMPYHGQWYGPTATLFAPNTVASIMDDDFDPPLEADGMIFACHYRRSKAGETTSLEMVPTGTEIVL